MKKESCPLCKNKMEIVRIETLIDDEYEFTEIWYCNKCRQETWIPYKVTECE